MSEVIRWNIEVSADADRAVRSYLAQTGMNKGDVSKFVEDAVRWRMFRITVDEARQATAALDPAELDDLINEAVDAARGETRKGLR